MADEALLRRAAERAGERSFYLASSLLRYARAEGWDDDDLAAALGCDPASLPTLLLCRQPRVEGTMFRADVEAIARRFGLDAARLGHMIRTANTLVAFGTATPDEQRGLLAAARDREGSADQPVRVKDTSAPEGPAE